MFDRTFQELSIDVSTHLIRLKTKKLFQIESSSSFRFWNIRNPKKLETDLKRNEMRLTHVAIALEGISAQVEFRQVAPIHLRTETQGVEVQRHQLVAVEIDAAQIGLVSERVGFDDADGVLAEGSHPHPVRKRLGAQESDPVVAGVQSLKAQMSLETQVVAQFLDFVAVQVEPLDAGRNEGVVEPAQVVVGCVDFDQIGQVVHHVLQARQVVRVEVKRLQRRQRVQRRTFHALQSAGRQIQTLEQVQRRKCTRPDDFERITCRQKNFIKKFNRIPAEGLTRQSQVHQIVQSAQDGGIERRDAIVRHVERLEEREGAQGGRDVFQSVAPHIQFLQIRTVLEGIGLDGCDAIVVQFEPTEHQQAVEVGGSDARQPIGRQFERVQVAEGREGRGFDALDLIVFQVETLQAVQVGQKVAPQADDPVAGQVQHNQPHQLAENGRFRLFQRQLIVGQDQHFQVAQRGQKSSAEIRQRVVGQIQLPQRRRRLEQSGRKRSDLIGREIQRLQLIQRMQRIGVDQPDGVAVQVQRPQVSGAFQSAGWQHRQLIVGNVQHVERSGAQRLVSVQRQIEQIRHPVVADIERLQGGQIAENPRRKRPHVVPRQIQRFQLGGVVDQGVATQFQVHGRPHVVVRPDGQVSQRSQPVQHTT